MFSGAGRIAPQTAFAADAAAGCAGLFQAAPAALVAPLHDNVIRWADRAPHIGQPALQERRTTT
jgi:hypothetical protein